MAKAPSLNEIRRRASRFVVDWRDEPGDERQQAQTFVRDLMQVYGIIESKAALFEYRARRSSTGNQGYIDALIPGLLLIEMKSAGRDLVAAEAQAVDYAQNLDHETPRYILTSDFQRFRLLDLHAPDVQPVEFTLEELPARAEALAFLAGYRERTFGRIEQEQASIKASQIMGNLYEALSDSGYDDHEASVFLVRILFCLYADDSGLWGERDLFYEFLERRTSEDGSDLGPQLAMLFQIMNRPATGRPKNLDEVLARFPYVNGGIFAEPAAIPSFDHGMRDLLLRACAFNWSHISPAVFGSLFQAVKDKEARRELGEHYTTETNILKTIEPLFLDELNDKYSAAYHDPAKLKRLRRDLGAIRVMDPACGCGNFLVVAYREMRALDLLILKRLRELNDESELPQSLLFTREELPVSIENFVGIELEEWPARIAATALHLVDHQANQDMEMTLGMAPDPLPLGRFETIHVANALTTDWNRYLEPSSTVRIVGNPPFLGPHSRSKEQLAEMQAVWGMKDLGRLDYVTAWYKKASDYFHFTRGGRFAFVSTNSIAQGDQVPRLFPPLFAEGWRIRFAHQTFAWTSEAPRAAAVHCVIVGFDKEPKTPARIYRYTELRGTPTEVPTSSISAYLVPGPSNVIVTARSTPLSPELAPVVLGSMAKDGGHLIIEPSDHAAVLADPIARKYVRRYLGSRELIHGESRWCLWLADADPNDIATSPVLRERVDAVRRFRLAAKAESTNAFASIPHLFTQRAPQATSFVCIPRVSSEHRPYLPVLLVDPEVIASDANYQVQDPDGLQFAILSSSALLAWQKAIGGRLKSDLRFAVRTVWNNFPLPKLTDAQRARIIEAGQRVLEVRAERPEWTLAQHYNRNAMRPELLQAHAALDRAVDAALGAKRKLHTEEERTAVLFNLYAASLH